MVRHAEAAVIQWGTERSKDGHRERLQEMKRVHSWEYAVERAEELFPARPESGVGLH